MVLEEVEEQTVGGAVAQQPEEQDLEEDKMGIMRTVVDLAVLSYGVKLIMKTKSIVEDKLEKDLVNKLMGGK